MSYKPGAEGDLERLRSWVRLSAGDKRLARAKAEEATTTERVFIRRAHAAGATLNELAEDSGLTRQRIQQLCDLSKEAGR